jgi:TRAP transporter TAXI family solute receptor
MQVKLPRWLRIVLVIGIILLAGGLAVVSYRYATRPVTLTVGVGSIDGDGVRLMTAIATRLASSKAHIRLKVVDKTNALAASQAFSAGETDLAIVRADLGDLSAARTIVLVTNGVVMLIAPPGSAIESIDDLKGKSVGVLGGEVNRRLVDVLDKEYDLARAKVRWKDLAPAEVQAALQGKQVDALLVVIPLSPKYLALVRGFFPRDGKRQPSLLSIESAGAIAAVTPSYESHDIPKGTLRGSPPIPDDDLTTLQVPYYLVANRKLDLDLMTELTKAVMEARGSLIGEHPLVAQISAPSTEKDAAIPIHPGAAAYFAGEEKTIIDKYGDYFWYGTMVLGMLTSGAAAVWKFVISDNEQSGRRSVDQLSGLSRRIREAREDELDRIEDEIDDILKSGLASSERGETDVTALHIALNRLGHLINQRRRNLEAGQARPG